MTAREFAKSIGLTVTCTWVDDIRQFSFCIPMITILDEKGASVRTQTIGFGKTPESAERNYCDLVRGQLYKKHSFLNDDSVSRTPSDLIGPPEDTEWLQSLMVHPVMPGQPQPQVSVSSPSTT